MKNNDLVPSREREINVTEILPSQQNQPESLTIQATRTVVSNFPQILSLAGDIIRIQQQIKQSSQTTDDRIREMKEKTEVLRAETAAYISRKQLDMNNLLARMNAIRSLMQDFYASNNGQLTSADFCTVITSVINMDKL